MLYRKYYSYNDMPKPIVPSPVKIKEEEVREVKKKSEDVAKFSIEKDDIILIAVLLTLLLNNCEDKLLIIAIVALLFL